MLHLVWLGDFNLNHLMWHEAWNTHLFMKVNLDKSQLLLDVLAEFDLQMNLPRDTPMLWALMSGNFTRPDNFFIASSLTRSRPIRCCTLPEEHPARTDHMPIITDLDIRPEIHVDPP